MMTERIQQDLKHQLSLLEDFFGKTHEQLQIAAIMLIAQNLQDINNRLSEIDTSLTDIARELRDAR